MADQNQPKQTNQANQQQFMSQQPPFGFHDPFQSFMHGPGPQFPPFQGQQGFPGQMPQMTQQQQQQPNPQLYHPFVQPFIDQNGKFDFNKIMAGMDNVHKMVSKTGPMIKQLSPLLNMFKK